MPTHFYRRKLPHIQPAEATFFVTFRLAGSLPVEVIRRLRENYELVEKGILEQKDLTEKERRELVYAEQKRLFAATDDFLDANPNESYWLREKQVAEIVANEMKMHDEQWYTLWSYCIMPNHVHLLLTLFEKAPVLTKIMQNVKSYSAQKSNRILGLSGQFWERESYDHVVRKDGEFERIVHYILQNPVKAKFVKDWADWPFTYLHPDLAIVYRNTSFAKMYGETPVSPP
jgi:REP element-mobilizing transposase RayT